MSPRGSIVARQVWKRFRPDRGRWLLRDQLPRLGSMLRRGQRTRWRWALRGVDFVVEPGEAVGLIGVNGSGKSTLLKILSGVMYPYAGSVEVSGRIGTLIELRAGLHPDLTGRENVFFYGSMLGLRRREVARRFDDIVAFAELEDAIDRQVKFYSTGMQLRLGFAVAAFLEPAVLLVDEVLAVGDVGFQQKCLGRMREVLEQGTTLVFVSHDAAAVEAMCTRAVWLNQGVVVRDGPVREVLHAYAEAVEQASDLFRREGEIRLSDIAIRSDGRPSVATGGPLEIEFTLEVPESRRCIAYLGLGEGLAAPIFVLRQDLRLSAGRRRVRCTVPSLPLPRGRYTVWGALGDAGGRELVPWHPLGHLQVSGPELPSLPRGILRLSPILVLAEWDVHDGQGE